MTWIALLKNNQGIQKSTIELTHSSETAVEDLNPLDVKCTHANSLSNLCIRIMWDNGRNVGVHSKGIGPGLSCVKFIKMFVEY